MTLNSWQFQTKYIRKFGNYTALLPVPSLFDWLCLPWDKMSQDVSHHRKLLIISWDKWIFIHTIATGSQWHAQCVFCSFRSAITNWSTKNWTYCPNWTAKRREYKIKEWGWYMLCTWKFLDYVRVTWVVSWFHVQHVKLMWLLNQEVACNWSYKKGSFHRHWRTSECCHRLGYSTTYMNYVTREYNPCNCVETPLLLELY